jgi:type II secretory pathway pseudopilin PulG
MKTQQGKAGFSLIEVNMAVFVMAIGVLSMVVLYPLGLRESTQGQADLKQAMFADYVLNQAVAAASQTNITWSQWSSVPNASEFKGLRDAVNGGIDPTVPDFIKSELDLSLNYPYKDKTQYKVACCLVPGASDKIMGIMVQSTELKVVTTWSNNPVYYAEVMFQGVP